MRVLHGAAVLGAGPTGSATAKDIAREALKVILLEEHAGVGRRSHCSGLATPRTLEVGRLGQDIVLNRIVGAHIWSPLAGNP